jgi:hypothetical protein
MCLPLDMIFAFLRRPKAVISRSEYIKVSVCGPPRVLLVSFTYLSVVSLQGTPAFGRSSCF